MELTNKTSQPGFHHTQSRDLLVHLVLRVPKSVEYKLFVVLGCKDFATVSAKIWKISYMLPFFDVFFVRAPYFSSKRKRSASASDGNL